MFHFCTYFDINYIHRGLALYRSLERYCDEFTLWVLCFDDRTHEVLTDLNLSKARLIRRREFETGDQALAAARGNRTKVEYYWTCTPSLPLYVFRQEPGIESLCYLDADIYFFSDPKAVFDALGQGNIFITPHDYDEKIYGKDNSAGRFNVGVLAFRHSQESLDCLRWWRQRCIEWCYFRVEEGKLGDQVYLDEWPERFSGVVAGPNARINAAPWNISKRAVRKDGRDRIIVDGEPLVCYHFHKVRFLVGRVVWVPHIPSGGANDVLDHVYRPYLEELVMIEKTLHPYNLRLPRLGIPWRKMLSYLIQGKMPRSIIRA